MKKLIALMLALSLCAVGALCFFGIRINEACDAVTITENVLFGDVGYAEGITVQTRSHYDYHLFWDTTYTVGSPASTYTEYTFSAQQDFPIGGHTYNGVTLDIDLQYGYDLRTPIDEQTGLKRAYRELYEETAPGTKGTKTIRLQDYYTYYPIRVAIDLPGTLWQGNDYDRLTDGQQNERAVWDAFNAFFKIPIPEDLPAFDITLTKNERGDGIGTGSNGSGIHFDIYPVTTYTDSQCFFAIGNRFHSSESIKDEFINTDLIPGGYGIYAFSWRNVQTAANTSGNITYWHDGYETGVDEASLAMVYPLAQETKVFYMTTSPDQTQLLLLTREHGSVWFTVIDIATMTELQKFKVSEEKYSVIKTAPDFLVIDGEETLSVIERQSDATYRLSFIVDRQPDLVDYSPHRGLRAQMDFDGERLVIVDQVYDTYYGTTTFCNFNLAVYDKTGLLYFGEYQSSLSTAFNPNQYAFNCLPLELSVALRKR